MKQISKTPQVLERLRAAFGADADLSRLAVYEATLLNTLPLRKSSGIFQGARNSLSLLSEMATAINKESVPLQMQHDTEAAPFGRLFYGEVGSDDQLRGWFAVDGSTHPEVVAKLDSGVIDQVSVGFLMKSLTCSACGFDYMGPDAWEQRYELTCDEGHAIGENGVHVFVDGLKNFFELSLVGKGAANGARIVGPSDAVLARSAETQRLAASARAETGFAGVRLTATPPTPKQDPAKMDPELLTRLEASASEKATALAQLAAATTQLEAANARVAELEPLAAAATERDAAKAAVEKAVTALQAEARTVLTACGKSSDNLPSDVDALLALIDEHRAQFAAVVPVGGKSKGPGVDNADTNTRSSTAFKTAR
jgi:hypothetical protein